MAKWQHEKVQRVLVGRHASRLALFWIQRQSVGLFGLLTGQGSHTGPAAKCHGQPFLLIHSSSATGRY